MVEYLAILIDEVSENLKNLVNFLIFWKSLVTCLVMYETKYMVDAILKTFSIKHKMANFKKYSPFVL